MENLSSSISFEIQSVEVVPQTKSLKIEGLKFSVSNNDTEKSLLLKAETIKEILATVVSMAVANAETVKTVNNKDSFQSWKEKQKDKV